MIVVIKVDFRVVRNDVVSNMDFNKNLWRSKDGLKQSIKDV